MATQSTKIFKLRLEAAHCYYCEREFDGLLRTADHVYPKSKGGSNDISNMVIACGECNDVKGCLDLYEFRYVLACKIRSNESLRKIPVERLKIIYKNVCLLANEKPIAELIKEKSFTSCKIPKLHRGEISNVPETIKPTPLDGVSVRLYNQRIGRKPLEQKRAESYARFDAANGYIYDESHKHVTFHIHGE